MNSIHKKLLLKLTVLLILILLSYFQLGNYFFKNRSARKQASTNVSLPADRDATASFLAQWKAPISFFGRVVDENDAPVQDADITFVWSDTSKEGTSTRMGRSDQAGHFEISGIRGKGLSVYVSKAGYYSYKNNQESFEYAIRSERTFHNPDRANPVVFRLRKAGIAEPILHRQILYGIRSDGTPTSIDLLSGRKTEGRTDRGDLVVRIYRGNGNGRQFDWSATIEAGPQSGISESLEEFMFLAPQSGYEKLIRTESNLGAAKWVPRAKRKFYFKGRGGQFFCRIEVEVIPKYNDKAAIDMQYWLNPSGSRNLEFDPNKEITPPPADE